MLKFFQNIFQKTPATNESEEDWKKSGISAKFPSYRNKPLVTTRSWLKGKNLDDEAEGLWRIHDDLYDLSSFVHEHPGGAFWLVQTRGTDITEAFETHHIRGVPQSLLDKFKVRKASNPRNYTLTLNEDGFYRTLKKRVAKELHRLDYGPRRISKIYHLSLLLFTPTFCILSTFRTNYFWIAEFMAGLSLVWLTNTAHNYFHQRDNWQMYTFNISLLNFAEWRISHAMSHHLYTNSLHDLELSLFEPFQCWVPNEHFAPKWRRWLMVLMQPIIYPTIIPFQFITRIIRSIFGPNEMYWHDIIGASLPLLMLAAAPAPFSPLMVMLQWMRIMGIASFIFALIGLQAAHHTPAIYHDGDAMRKDRDWGLFQLDACMERSDVQGSLFLTLTHYGDHAMHHLFPTLDHAVLPQLHPVFQRTVEEFFGEWRSANFATHLIGQNRQLLRTTPNPIPPDQRQKA